VTPQVLVRQPTRVCPWPFCRAAAAAGEARPRRRLIRARLPGRRSRHRGFSRFPCGTIRTWRPSPMTVADRLPDRRHPTLRAAEKTDSVRAE